MLLPETGTYILVIKVDRSKKTEVGRIGKFNIDRGYYFYIGSAHGPGGIRARILRHLKRYKKKHWHIDYLRKEGSIVAIVIKYSKKKMECSWASKLGSYPALSTPINGFGSSDCSCPSHLFFGELNFNIYYLKNILKASFEYINVPPL